MAANKKESHAWHLEQNFSFLRLCLVSHGMQNVKYKLLWNDEIQNAKIFMGVFSSIQNAKFFMGWVRAF
jgi:hypothetical protein